MSHIWLWGEDLQLKEVYTTNSITKGGLKGSSCCVLKSYRGSRKGGSRSCSKCNGGGSGGGSSGGAGRPGEPVVIELDGGKSEPR